MRYEVVDVAWRIIKDEKRVENLRKINNRIRRLEKVNGMITAVCREQKINLTNDEKAKTRLFLNRKLKECHGFSIF